MAFFEVENKENSPEKLAAIQGKLTKFFLMAEEWNLSVEKINELWDLIAGLSLDDVLFNGPITVNKMIEMYSSDFSKKAFVNHDEMGVQNADGSNQFFFSRLGGFIFLRSGPAGEDQGCTIQPHPNNLYQWAFHLPNKGGTFALLDDIPETVPLITEDTYENIGYLVDDNQLVPGKIYVVTDADADVYGGTQIMLLATSQNTFQSEAVGRFLNPKYDQSLDGYGIFGTKPHERDGVVFWGGKAWTGSSEWNGTGGASIDEFTLDAQYTLAGEENYNVVYDSIYYDFKNNFILSRFDGTNLVKMDVYYRKLFSIFYGYNPIKSFQWGNVYTLENQKGIHNCVIVNSVNLNINYVGKMQKDFEFKNGSICSGNVVSYTSYQRRFKLDNSTVQSNTLGADSWQGDFDFVNSALNSNVLAEGCSQNKLTFNSFQQNEAVLEVSTYQDNVSGKNGSQYMLNIVEGQYQKNVDIKNYERTEQISGANELNVSWDENGLIVVERYKALVKYDGDNNVQVKEFVNTLRDRTFDWAKVDDGIVQGTLSTPFDILENMIVNPKGAELVSDNGSFNFNRVYGISKNVDKLKVISSSSGDLSIPDNLTDKWFLVDLEYYPYAITL